MLWFAIWMFVACTGEPGPQADPASDSTLVSSHTGSTDTAPPSTDTSPTTTAWTGWGSCTEDAECDDGLSCSHNSCSDGRCIAVPLSDCAWPATDVEQLAGLNPALEDQLSGADHDPDGGRLWLVRSGSAVSNVFRLARDGNGWAMDSIDGAAPATWPIDGDAEGITTFDPTEPDSVLLVTDGQNTVEEYDLSGASSIRVASYNTAPFIVSGGGNDGAEGITFVPDAHLAAWGFTDPEGNPTLSEGGMGGLVFVAHQTGGKIYVFDLDRSTSGVRFVGAYSTARDESAGLEFDASTGRLLIFHGGGHNDLEVARLSSTQAGGSGRFDTEYLWDYPADLDTEGLAIAPVGSCDSGGRELWLIADDEGSLSLQWYRDWVCH
jgi:hypothetical protein